MPSRPAGTSGWAIASLVLGILGGVLLSVIFGIVGLRQIGKTGQKGQGFAIAGLVLSGLWTVVLLLVFLGALVANNGGSGTQPPSGALSVPSSGTTSAPTSGASSAPPSSTHVSPSALKVGDCFDNPITTGDVLSVNLVPCTQAHNAQVFATFKLTGSNLSYPGDTAIQKLSANGCMARNDHLDQAKLNSSMDLYYIYPKGPQWIFGQRTVKCVVATSQPDLNSSLLAPGAPA